MPRFRGTPQNASRKSKGNPQARATCAAADFHASSLTYVQHIRDAAADLILERQNQCIDSISNCENAVLELLLDTELNISIPRAIDGGFKNNRTSKVIHVNTSAPAVVVHASIKFSSGVVAFSQGIVVSMIALEVMTVS